MEFPGKLDGLGYGNNMVFPVDVTVRQKWNLPAPGT